MRRVSRNKVVFQFKPKGTPRRPVGGVGTELAKMFAWIRNLRPERKATCGCAERATEMDQNGIEWCERSKDTIIAGLRQGAAELDVIFIEHVARWALFIAIRRAKENLKKG
jgi:hypothetical protein